MFFSSFFVLSFSYGCIDRVKEAKAGMILLTSERCTNCNRISRIIADMKPILPKGSKICTEMHHHFFESYKSIMKRKPNYDVPNFALFRKGKFVSIASDTLNEKTISHTMNALLHPPVHFVDDSNISNAKFYRTEKTIIFKSFEDFEPFYQVAIHFRNYPFTFLVGEGEFSATMVDNLRKRTINYRGYPESLIEWVAKVTDITPPLPFTAKNNSMLLYTTYGAVPQEIEEIYDKLSYLIGDHISLGYANWDRDHLMLKNCSVSPADGTFVAFSNGICYPFVDEDVITPELLAFFLSKVVQGFYLNPRPCAPTARNFGRVVPLDARTIEKKIPSHKCAVLHLSNSESLSHNSVSQIYAKVARKFTQKNLAFYELDTHLNWAPSYVPNNDRFPLIAMWRPNDRRPMIFRDVLTNGSLANWVLAKAISSCNLTISEN
ncbi:hypothetical protein TRFO_28748 [Tritrichomonas foetus]|uniref:Thioredoxin domain-containing protein n=1 Tax=Tritrichomonas foetus TaxID=1144522 RepID=A0A1J4JXM4_9EUKA|nr:hypothetical protein TRFO_28748 [Tritrichomonas foetus]|eukprot:OHT03903.1 hypothetical protein TRFO_28748 [Tritrichomonas foetus]